MISCLYGIPFTIVCVHITCCETETSSPVITFSCIFKRVVSDEKYSILSSMVYYGRGGGRLYGNKTEETRHKFRRIVATLKVALGSRYLTKQLSFPLSVDPIITPMIHTWISLIHHCYINLLTDSNKKELKKTGKTYTGLPGFRRNVAVPLVFWNVRRRRLVIGYRRFGTSNQSCPHELSSPGLLEHITTDCNVPTFSIRESKAHPEWR